MSAEKSFDYFDEMLSNQKRKVLKLFYSLVNNNNTKSDDNNDKKIDRKLSQKKLDEPCHVDQGKYKQCHGANL